MSDKHAMIMAHVEPTAVQTQHMHPLVGAAMAQGQPFDPETLGKLMDLQQRWEAAEARKAYTHALAGLKRDLPSVIHKDAVVDFTAKSGQRTYYKHASLAGMMDAITEPLTAHGFALSWTPSTSERLVRVTCRLTHTEGHFEEASLEAPADTSGNKSPAQAIASTITLLQRYSALALLGIATADMKEPESEERGDSDGVDARLNLRAAAWVVKQGRTREAAEAHIGRPVSKWTAADLRELRTWASPPDDVGPSDADPSEDTAAA